MLGFLIFLLLVCFQIFKGFITLLWSGLLFFRLSWNKSIEKISQFLSRNIWSFTPWVGFDRTGVCSYSSQCFDEKVDIEFWPSSHSHLVFDSQAKCNKWVIHSCRCWWNGSLHAWKYKFMFSLPCCAAARYCFTLNFFRLTAISNACS